MTPEDRVPSIVAKTRISALADHDIGIIKPSFSLTPSFLHQII
jgi:hypothetical protein